MNKKLVDRRFVKFGSVQLDVNTIQALAYQLQQRNGQDASGNPIVVNTQVAVLMLESGSSVTIGDESLKMFEHWWKENVESEQVVLPTAGVETVAPPIAANADKPVATPTPTPAPTPATEATLKPAAATPEVAKPVVNPPVTEPPVA